VAPGDEIRSRPGGRLALRIGELSLRLDQDSDMTVLAADRVELRRGALYVDSGADATSGNRLRVATPFGDVSHVGTQYETRVTDDRLRVRVREGRVRIAVREGGVADGAAGQQLTFGQGGVQRAAIDRASADWAWAGEIAPAYELENRSLAQFLSWVGRETGREVVFDSPASQAEAERIVLRGSTAGLSPERALAAVMSTTRLGHGESVDRLFIEFRTGESR
jgi:ferric-dicitrate binding protein FerR (iron transport regulator)